MRYEKLQDGTIKIVEESERIVGPEVILAEIASCEEIILNLQNEITRLQNKISLLKELGIN